MDETRKKISRYGRKKLESKNRIAKKIVDEMFQSEWDNFYIDNNVNLMDPREIAEEFYYMGITEGLNYDDKDYKVLKEQRKKDEMSRLKAERMVKELKMHIFKIKKDGKLNVKRAISMLAKAQKKYKEDEVFVNLINDEIEFLNNYKTKREK